MRLWAQVDTFDMGLLKDKALKPLEEASEAREAVQRLHDANGSEIGEMVDVLRHKAVYECCDTIQATGNLLAALGVTQRELDSTMAEVHASNERRGRYE